MKSYRRLNYYCFNVTASDWYSGNVVSFRRYLRLDDRLKLVDIQKIICSESKKLVASFKNHPWFKIKCNDEYRFVIGNYYLKDFVKNNRINPHCINVAVDFPDGLGAGGSLGDSITMEIRARESEHNGRPHVHVYKRKKLGVSIALWDFRVLCGEKNWEKEFSPKQRREVIKTLKTKQKEFSQFYNDLQNGIVPENVWYIYQGEEYCLKYKS